MTAKIYLGILTTHPSRRPLSRNDRYGRRQSVSEMPSGSR